MASAAVVRGGDAGSVGPGRGPYGAMPGDRGLVPYGTTKAALERFTQGLAQEVYQYGISVTCFAPSEVVPTAATVFQGWSRPIYHEQVYIKKREP